MSRLDFRLDPLDRLVRELSRLPGIGTRSAERIALHLVQAPTELAGALSAAIREAREAVGFCAVCGALAPHGERCVVCRAGDRVTAQVCVVERPEDVLSLERAGGYRGLYHVLGGRLSPLDGVAPEDLRIDALVERVRDRRPDEVILATGADVEGEATATYLVERLRPFGVRLTRIAHGIPVGSALGYADAATLSRALQGRREMS